MKGHEFFGVIVRTIGILSILHGLWVGYSAFVAPAQLFDPWTYVKLAAPSLVSGIIFYLQADAIVLISYPREFRQL